MNKVVLLLCAAINFLALHADNLTIRYSVVNPDDTLKSVVEGKCDTNDLIAMHDQNASCDTPSLYPINLSPKGDTYILVDDYYEQTNPDSQAVACIMNLTLCDEGESYQLPPIAFDKNQTLVLANKAGDGSAYMLSVGVFTSYPDFAIDNASLDDNI